MTGTLNLRQVGRTDLRIPELGFGTVALGLLPDAEAGIGHAAVQRALSRGMTFFDTAPYYGNGRAELRLGEALSGAPRQSYQLASKVGRIVTEADQGRENAWQPPFDYSYDGVLLKVAGQCNDAHVRLFGNLIREFDDDGAIAAGGNSRIRQTRVFRHCHSSSQITPTPFACLQSLRAQRIRLFCLVPTVGVDKRVQQPSCHFSTPTVCQDCFAVMVGNSD